MSETEQQSVDIVRQVLDHHALLTTQAMHNQHRHTEAVLQAFTDSLVQKLCITQPPHYLPLLKEILQVATMPEEQSKQLAQLIQILEGK